MSRTNGPWWAHASREAAVSHIYEQQPHRVDERRWRAFCYVWVPIARTAAADRWREFCHIWSSVAWHWAWTDEGRAAMVRRGWL